MKIVGLEILKAHFAENSQRQLKCVFDEQGIIFSSTSVQHSTLKAPGISYEDNYQGNALAAILDNSKFEIRGHDDFSPERVRFLWHSLVAKPELVSLAKLSPTYRGKIVPKTSTLP